MTMILYELCSADEGQLFSPHCWKTRMSLAHKGLDYKSISTTFTEIPHIENGVTKSVPLLKDGDVIVSDSFEIARYLDRTYPDAPSLLGGEKATALTAFIINWSQSQLHPLIGVLVMKDIHDILADVDQTYFRQDRESKTRTTLENLHDGRNVKIDQLLKALLPLKLMLKHQRFIGGETPLFADYVVFGALQWMRITCTIPVLPQEGEIAEWFDRLLDMYDGMGRAAKPAI